MASSACLGPSGFPRREPTALCAACGARGTVGHATRFTEDAVSEIHRFCAPCWPEQYARLRARWEEEDRVEAEAWLRTPDAPTLPSRGATFEAETWHITLEELREIRRALQPTTPPSPADLAHYAARLSARTVELEGPVPAAVEAFIQEYGAPAS
jgi:hypothetical protein